MALQGWTLSGLLSQGDQHAKTEGAGIKAWLPQPNQESSEELFQPHTSTEAGIAA